MANTIHPVRRIHGQAWLGRIGAHEHVAVNRRPQECRGSGPIYHGCMCLHLEPVDTIEIVLYHLVDDKAVDIVHQTVEAKGLSSTQLQDFSVYLSTVQAGDAWAGKSFGVAIRATGAAGGFWDLDNVRLAESLPPAPPAPTAKEQTF